jgi:hypothetical protein
MKKIFSTIAFLSLGFTVCNATPNPIQPLPAEVRYAAKLDIKLKNDTDDEVTVINAGSGGTYRLQKNIVTTIKMDAGDKLFIYDGGKKGRLLLTASSDLDGKLQLFSKL